MKRSILFLLIVARLSAQLIVNDPINTSVTTAIQAGQAANHLEVLRQWAQQLENLNRQLQQLEAQLTEQRRIREVMGEPSLAGAQITLRELGVAELATTVGETAAAVRRVVNAATTLRNTAEGIFPALENRTSLGIEFTRQENPYRRYGAIERQAANFEMAQDDVNARTAALQVELGATLEQLKAASTQAEVDKLNGKIMALNGQLANAEAQRRGEADKLTAQQILNENQAAKERQDLLERQAADERQAFGAMSAWQRGVKLTPADYTR